MSRLLNQKAKLATWNLETAWLWHHGDLTANPDGTISDRTIEYYAARAKGGIGLIITGIVRINTDGTAGPNQISLADDSYIPGFKKLVDEFTNMVLRYLQIQHSGRQGVAALTGKDYVLAPSPFLVLLCAAHAGTDSEEIHILWDNSVIVHAALCWQVSMEWKFMVLMDI